MTKNLTQLSYYLGAVYGDREMKMDQTSLRSVVTYITGLPLTKLRVPLNMWSRDFMWQNKNVVSALSQDL